MIPVTHLREGTIFEENGAPLEVLKYTHTKLGRGNANIKVRVRNLKSGAIFERTFVSGGKVNEAQLEKKKAQFLYEASEECYFMDSQTFDQFSLPKKILGGRRKFLKSGGEVEILFYKGRPLNISLPPHLEFKVIGAPPGVRGDSAVNIFKDVTLEGGVVVRAPLFIKAGDKIVIDTRTGEYVKKIKNQKKFKNFEL